MSKTRRTQRLVQAHSARKTGNPLNPASDVLQPVSRNLVTVVFFAVLAYAFLAGLRTVTDFDLGWQMATGRWMWSHHQILSVDVFSYTAQGKPWIYPVGSGILFYAIYLIGGFGLLSWLGAAACAGTVALVLRRDSAVSATLAVFSIPVLAGKTTPRADMFTTVLFAAFLTLLWKHYETGRAKLWLLPPLMVTWVNLHLGFVSGLALVGAYAIAECLELAWPNRRAPARDRLSKALPWLVLVILATFINPWGWGIYRAIFRQQEVTATHSERISEWLSYRLNWTIIESSLSLRHPEPFIVLLLAAVVAIPIALWKQNVSAAALMTGAGYIAFRHVRFQALFCEVMVVVAAAVLASASAPFLNRNLANSRQRPIFAGTISGCLLLLIAVRSADLVSNRTYMSTTTFGSFGAGLSWWFPERAADFIEREKLPGNIFNSFNEGGFFTWRLGTQYPDYIDGRNIPFGTELLDRNQRLMRTPPDDPEWVKEADRYNINTILIPLARYHAFDYFPLLRQFCASHTWRPVFLDEVSVVFVREAPATQSLIERFPIDCLTAPIPPVPTQTEGAVAFNQWANAATVLHGLARNREALEASERALSIFPASGYMHARRASLLLEAGRVSEAKQGLLTAVALQPTGEVWSLLAELYHRDGQLSEAIQAWERASELLRDPAPAFLSLGYANLEANQPHQALALFDRTVAEINEQSEADNQLLATVARGRAAAYTALADWNHAVQFQQDTVRLVPNRNQDWLYLADLYDRVGRAQEAQAARARAANVAGR